MKAQPAPAPEPAAESDPQPVNMDMSLKKEDMTQRAAMARSDAWSGSEVPAGALIFDGTDLSAAPRPGMRYYDDKDIPYQQQVVQYKDYFLCQGINCFFVAHSLVRF